MAVARRGSSEFRPAFGAVGFRSGAGLLALMAEKVAKGGKLSSVAPVFPALGFGSLVENAYGRVAAHGLGHDFVDAAAADERGRVRHALLVLAGSVHLWVGGCSGV